MLADSDTDMKGPLHAGVAALSLEHDVTTLVGDAPDVDPSQAQTHDALFFVPDGYLCGRLLQAIARARANGAPCAIVTESGRLSVCPEQDVVLTEMTETTLRWLASVRIANDRVSLEDAADGCPTEPDNMDLRRGTEGMLWMTTLWAARGRVPVGTSLSAPVRLERWPNMTRLLLFPHSLRIAALWAREPVSLLDTAERLKIPQRFVFSFYSAAKAVGLIAGGEKSDDTHASGEAEAMAAGSATRVAEPPAPAVKPSPAVSRRRQTPAGEAETSAEEAPTVAPPSEEPKTVGPAGGRAPGDDSPDHAPEVVAGARASAGTPGTDRRESAPHAARVTASRARPVSAGASTRDDADRASEERRLDEAIKRRNERLSQLREQQAASDEQVRPVRKKGAVARFLGAFSGLFGRKS